MAVVIGSLNLEWNLLFPVGIALLLWPAGLWIYRPSGQAVKNLAGNPPVAFAVAGWMIIAGSLIVTDYLQSRAVTWSVYPTLGIALWPAGMILYRFLAQHSR